MNSNIILCILFSYFSQLFAHLIMDDNSLNILTESTQNFDFEEILNNNLNFVQEKVYNNSTKSTELRFKREDDQFKQITKIRLYHPNDFGNFRSVLRENIDDIPTKVRLIFIFHGYRSSGDRSGIQLIKNSLYKKLGTKCRVFIVDWSYTGRVISPLKSLPNMIQNAKDVGLEMAVFLKKMVEENKLNPQDIYLIGFSLGGQIVGWTGRWFANLTAGSKIGRITGNN